MLVWAIEGDIVNFAIWMFFHKCNELFRCLKVMGDVLCSHHIQSALQGGRQFFCRSRGFKVVNIGMAWNLDQFCQVRTVNVREGDTVTKGQTLLVLEAMKMEIRIQAPQDGVVTKSFVEQGQTVEREQILMEIEQD